MSNGIEALAPGVVLVSFLLSVGCSPSAEGPSPNVFDGGLGGGDGRVADAERSCEFGEITPGFCSPEPPRGTPADQCPSGRRAGGDDFQESGVCLPQYPSMQDWECPESWRKTPAFVDSDGNSDVPEGIGPFHYCEPPPLPEHCSFGQMPVLGKEECQTVGLECPDASDWFHDEQSIRDRAPNFTGEVIYADARSSSPGDGTEQKPFRTISDAIASASAGDIVALAPVQFEEQVEIDKRIAVVGGCASKSQIAAPSPTTSVTNPTVGMTAAGSKLSDVGITGDRVGLAVYRASDERVQVQSVAVNQARRIGVFVARASATFSRLAVEGTKPRPSDDKQGLGVRLQQGARAKFIETTLEKNHSVGLNVNGSGTVLERATDLVVRDTRSRADSGSGGFGIGFGNGGSGELQRTLVDNNRAVGVFLVGNETAIEDATHLVVRKTRPRRADNEDGIGIEVQKGAELAVDQTLLEGNRAFGLEVDGEGSAVTRATNLVVRNTRPRATDQKLGFGIFHHGSTAKFRRTLLAKNHSVGLVVGRKRATLERARDVVVWNTQPRAADRSVGIGVLMRHGASGSLERVLIEDNYSLGLTVQGEGTALEQLSDVAVRHTRARERDGYRGLGISIDSGARVRMRRVSVTGNRTVGIAMIGEGTVVPSAKDIVVRNTKKTAKTGKTGMGIGLENGAAAKFQRVLVDRNRTAGIIARGSSTEWRSLEDVVIRRTRQHATTQGLGYGILLEQGATMTLRRGWVEDNHSAGLLAFGGETSVERAADLVVRNTVSSDARSESGHGIHLRRSASVTLENGFIGGNERNGMILSDVEDSRVANSAITDNEVGVVMERANDIEFVETRIEGNERKNRRCENQCYKEPDSPGRIDPSGSD